MAKYTARVVAVLGRTRRIGRWTVSSDTSVVAIFGSCQLDLTRSVVEDDAEEISISVLALFGSVTILLPQGTQVHPSGMAIAASAGIDLPLAGEATSLVPLDLDWTAVFARVRVTENSTVAPPPRKEIGVTPKRAEPVEASPPDSQTTAETPSNDPTNASPPKMATITQGIPNPLDYDVEPEANDVVDETGDSEGDPVTPVDQDESEESNATPEVVPISS